MLLIAWDIDWTLASVSLVSREIYRQAFLQVLGRPPTALPDMAGRTELAIITEALRLSGTTPSAELIHAVTAAMNAATAGLVGQMAEDGYALPGAGEAIAALRRPGVVQTVVTGNLPPIAAAKLAAFGLGGLLDLTIGGYGDLSADRADLVREARSRAAAKHGPIPASAVVVIGDTPHDVHGAHDADAYAIGVATGRFTAAELTAAGADLVLPDLTDLSLLLALVDRHFTTLGPPSR